jgi:flagellar biogenesis protein FliO
MQVAANGMILNLLIVCFGAWIMHRIVNADRLDPPSRGSAIL